jgi:DNA-binding NtrC family response regulator
MERPRIPTDKKWSAGCLGSELRPRSESSTGPIVQSESVGCVLLRDERRDRLLEISRIIDGARMHPVVIEDFSDRCLAEFSARCFVALASTGEAASGAGMQAIRALRTKGFKVLAYEDGADRWPIKTKCLPLLAGAVQLFDSLRPNFPRELCEAVERIVCVEMKKRSNADNIKAIMRGLGMIGESATMMTVFRAVIRFSALSDLPVLISGETGTGKEALARAVHSLDLKRNHGPFVPVNCGAISRALVESEFFGHRRGAFTGAERERKGLFRSAEGGVLFLDEIAELDLALQSRLLRVLQENRVLAVGEDREVEVSVRVVAATNHNLDQLMQQNKFRPDLFHRLNVLSISVPPLRERPDDLAPLVEHFLQKYRLLTAPAPQKADADFLEALRQIELPGNVRQLENLVRQALVAKTTDLPLNLSDLSVEILRQLLQPEENTPAHKTELVDLFNSETFTSSFVRILEANDWNLRRSLENCERQALEAAIRRTRGNQSEIARLLGITPRSVYNKVHKYRLLENAGNGAATSGPEKARNRI